MAASSASRVAEMCSLLLISPFWLSSEFVSRLLKFPAPVLLSLSGLHAGLILWIGLRPSQSGAVQDIWDIHREELGVVPPDLILAFRAAFDRSSRWCR